MCLRAARNCDDLDQLTDYARTHNDQFGQALPDGEVMQAAKSAWCYESEGRNYVDGRCAVISTSEVLPPMRDPYVCALMVWAKSKFKPEAEFWIADGLAEKFGWSLYELRQARKKALEMGVIRLIRKSGFRRPALYGFGTPLSTG
jgi:hypothetical protein